MATAGQLVCAGPATSGPAHWSTLTLKAWAQLPSSYPGRTQRAPAELRESVREPEPLDCHSELVLWPGEVRGPSAGQGWMGNYLTIVQSMALARAGAGVGSLALIAFLGQGYSTEPASWVQLWARHCRWNKGSIDAATHRADPWASIRGLAGSFIPWQAHLYHCPQGPGLQQSHKNTGKGSVRPGGGSLKNAAPAL